MVPSIRARGPSAEAAPEHQTTTTMSDCWRMFHLSNAVFLSCQMWTGRSFSRKFNCCISSLQRMVPKVFSDVPQQMWGLQVVRWCSRFDYDLLDELSLHSWLADTVGSALFPLFVDDGSDCCFLETQYLGNGFITLSRLTDFTHFDSQLFLNLFGSWHEVFLELFHFDRQVILKWIYNWTGGQQTLAFLNNVANHSWVKINKTGQFLFHMGHVALYRVVKISILETILCLLGIFV